MTFIYFIIGAVIICAFIAFGITHQGPLHYTAIFIAGFYFGHLITEALNFVKTKEKT